MRIGNKKERLGAGLHISDKIRIAKICFAVGADHKGNGWRIEDLDKADLPEALEEGGAITDPMGLGEILAPLARRMKLETVSVTAALPGPQVYFRTMVLPAVSKKYLKKSVLFEAERFLPIPAAEAAVSVCLSKDFNEGGEKRMEVFLAAARKQHVMNLKISCQQAKLNLKTVEFEPLALQRMIGIPEKDLVYGYLFLNYGHCAVCIFDGALPQYYRYFHLMPQVNIWDVQNSEEFWAGAGTENAAFYTGQIISELKRALEYCHQQYKNAPDSVIICGSLQGADSLRRALTNEFGFGVEIRALETLNTALAESAKKEELHTGEYLAALGLALREVF
ncbi:MAG: pilus assembly protein PilM [Syntrophomonadaceae bacterium]|jgi:Tfp pilus assembly PilM family ATPase|nr:pilus assembly protein PilM [Syntrophomonadaceae bacterium]